MSDLGHEINFARLASLLETLLLQQQDGNGGEQKEGETTKPEEPVQLPAKKIDREQFLKALRELLDQAAQANSRTNREQGKPCCDNMAAPTVSSISVQRKRGDAFETPANGLFDVGDTIKVQCSILGCPPLDIRFDTIERGEDDSGTRILTADQVSRGTELLPDPAHPNDPGSHRYVKEIDLSAGRFSVNQSPGQVRLNISVRDNCKRVATAGAILTFVDFS